MQEAVADTVGEKVVRELFQQWAAGTVVLLADDNLLESVVDGAVEAAVEGFLGVVLAVVVGLLLLDLAVVTVVAAEAVVPVVAVVKTVFAEAEIWEVLVVGLGVGVFLHYFHNYLLISYQPEKKMKLCLQ